MDKRSEIKHKPKNILLLGYGAVGKAFTKILLKDFDFSETNFKVCDVFDLNQNEKIDEENKKFEYIKMRVDRDNMGQFLDHIGEGDILVDLSTAIDYITIWSECQNRKIMYLNSALELWVDNDQFVSFPETESEIWSGSATYFHEKISLDERWTKNHGVTSVLEHGFNPGLISHCVKKGLLDAAEYFLNNKENYLDLDFDKIENFLKVKNYTKLAQEIGLFTIHCSESDDQYIANVNSADDELNKNNLHFNDVKTKLYNTWSAPSFISEAMIPVFVAIGSHEDKQSEELPRLHKNNNSFIVSYAPSYFYWAKSWVPDEDIEGCMIPHGETYTITNFLKDEETGWVPTQFFVYNYNRFAKEFMKHLPRTATIQDVNPDWEVIHPLNHPIKGYDKVGALLIFKNNRGWFTGSLMDDNDCKKLFNHQFGPTILQVAAGVFSAFLYMINNPQSGCHWPEDLDSEFILEKAKPYLGQFYSNFVNLNDTKLKDCYKFEDFITKRY